MSIEKLNIVSSIFHDHQSILSFEINSFVAKGNITQIKQSCLTEGIDTDTLGDVLTINLNSFIEPNLILFDQLCSRFEYTYITQEFSILKTNGEYCHHSSDSLELYFSVNASDSFKNSCQNIFSYFRLYNYLKSNVFADHHNSADREIVIYNSAKGIFKIKYDSVPTIDESINISKVVDGLISTASPVELTSFFKNALITISNDKGSISLSEIIINSADIIAITHRDYALVSKQFDFDNFRDSLYKEKEKYFNNIRDILNKIFSQAVGIPISISATVFATYKVSDDTFMLLLVMLSFIIYLIFYIKIQMVYKSDITEIERDFVTDFDMINLKSGLPSETVCKEKVKIERKIASSLSMVNLLIVIVMGLGILVCWYIFYEIGKSETICLFKALMKLL